MDTRALGLIEVKGYLGAIEAADSALKAANVRLIGVEKVKGGLTTVKLGGDVAAVGAAVEAGAAAANRLNVLLSKHVIARAHEELAAIIENGRQAPVKEQIIEEAESLPAPLEKEREVLHEQADLTDREGGHPQEEEEHLNLRHMKVEELRRLARRYRVPNLSGNEIKFGRKEDLIHAIEDFFGKEGD
ncbi:MAG: BMC domain-containing protein [Ectobacillus sp.]